MTSDEISNLIKSTLGRVNVWHFVVPEDVSGPVRHALRELVLVFKFQPL